MNLYKHKLNNRKQLSILVILISFIAFGRWQPLNVVNAEATKTLKACHICDPILPDASATPTPTPTPTLSPDACTLDCIDPELPPFQEENTPNIGEIQPEGDALSIIFYWMDGCPHCDDVMKNILPLVENEFGSAIHIQKVELKTLEEVNQLFTIGKNFGYTVEQIGVPFIIVGEHAITGDKDIAKELPILIRTALPSEESLEITVESNPESVISKPLLFIVAGFMVALMIVGLFFLRKRAL